MSASRTRFLRPSVLALLPSGLWAVDEFHPVAAVLDPDTGALHRVVSWAQVPIPGPKDLFAPLPIVKSDGTGLWVQYDLQGPLVRVDEDGLGAAVWTDGLELVACGPGVAWCAAWTSGEEPTEGDRPWLDHGRLLRVDREGHATPVQTHGRIEQIKSGPDALFVQLVVPPIDSTGSGITPATGSVSLPWDVEVPGELPAAGYGVPEGDEPDWDAWGKSDWDGVGKRHYSSHQAPHLPTDVTTDRHRWVLGSIQQSSPPAYFRRRLLATAHTPDGAEVRRWDLGRGPDVLSTRSLGNRLAVTVARPDGTSEVLALDPDTDEVSVLLATDAVEITNVGWPRVPRPVHADSYVAQVQANWSRLDFSPGELSDVRATLRGEWPDTQLEWTFRWTGRPGLFLRNRVRLFDELGRIAYPDQARMDLREALSYSGGVPPAEDALEGYLEL